MCHGLWQGDCTCKQVVNRLKIPQGLSTLLFHRWSEVTSRGGVRSDSLYEKLPALQSQRCHLSVFSECCFLELLARLFSIRTLLLTGFVVLCSHLQGSVLLRVVFVGLLSNLTGSFQGFFFGLLQPRYCCYLVVLLCLAFHRAPFILNASFWAFFIHFFCPHPSSSSCGFGLFSVSQGSSLLSVLFGGVFHMCHRLWQGDCTCKQVVNRLKIPQGLSTLLFHRWSEVPSRGGVRSDSLYEKLPALQSQSCHLPVFCECCFLELLARPSSIRTILLSCSLQPFVGLCSSQSCFHRAPFQFYWFILGLFLLWPSTIQLLWLVFLFCSAFHQAPLILNASGGGGGGGGGSHTPACTQLFQWFCSCQHFLVSLSLFIVCFSGVVHMSQPVRGRVISHTIVNRW